MKARHKIFMYRIITIILVFLFLISFIGIGISLGN